MKENLVNISFAANGHVVQDVVMATDDPITAEELVRMLQCGEAYTTIHEDNDVIMSDGAVIGTVRYSDTELEFSSYQVEGGDYEQENSLQPFNASRLARSFAMGEFISEADDMDAEDITAFLKMAGDNQPQDLGLAIEEGSMDKTGNELLREIELAEYGFKNLMTIAHAAGKQGKEII